ncbi:MFS transporter TsgA [Edwardsiella piscicida]|uniref:MFS transporter TsgA n=1 Tax=Edwardsiella piscicida TaxID=1263550 RepID=UPI0002C051BE|nr:MFS transporter TsgA [Edwardsiella piscicida]AGH74800.1 transporter [Edwardsiella piscicida C07-087]EKS7779427.1 MFS transporter TsgA [Edwardsiella piscicida]EKS7782848.1 MFS transporter TsgA [Edwardsiella piscicida]UCQ23810.1 MFS transporter TsgA [Edwardsiella piscicida]UCQ33961.1 MFS transporter TsgA [Edwardsiella piscicida]
MQHHDHSRGRLNAISYLSYYFVGALVSTLGIVLGPLCVAFQKDPSFIGQIFTLMNIGMFIPIMFGGLLIKKWGLQKPLAAAALFTIIISIVLFTTPTLTLFSVAVAVIGACGGIFMTIGSYLVVRINPDEKSRSSSLIFTDFFFSLAGATLSFLLAWMFTLGASWIAMYAIMGALGVLMLLFVLRARFPGEETAAQPQAEAPAAVAAEPWGISVWLICLALFLFLLAEPIFTLWTPGYLQLRFAMQPEQAALYTTVYWVSKAIGLFLNQFTVKWMRLRTFLLICTVIGMGSIALISNGANASLILIACGTFGFFNSGLFSGLMSYGSLQVRRSSPTLISALLTCGTVGTLLFASVSSLINSRFGLHGALNSATVAYGLLLLTLLSAAFFSKAERLQASAPAV